MPAQGRALEVTIRTHTHTPIVEHRNVFSLFFIYCRYRHRLHALHGIAFGFAFPTKNRWWWWRKKKLSAVSDDDDTHSMTTWHLACRCYAIVESKCFFSHENEQRRRNEMKRIFFMRNFPPIYFVLQIKAENFFAVHCNCRNVKWSSSFGVFFHHSRSQRWIHSQVSSHIHWPAIYRRWNSFWQFLYWNLSDFPFGTLSSFSHSQFLHILGSVWCFNIGITKSSILLFYTCFLHSIFSVCALFRLSLLSIFCRCSCGCRCYYVRFASTVLLFARVCVCWVY